MKNSKRDSLVSIELEEAKNYKWQATVDELGGLPQQKIHCSILASEGLKKVIDQYVDSVTLADLVNNHEEKCGKLDL